MINLRKVGRIAGKLEGLENISVIEQARRVRTKFRICGPTGKAECPARRIVKFGPLQIIIVLTVVIEVAAQEDLAGEKQRGGQCRSSSFHAASCGERPCRSVVKLSAPQKRLGA